MEDAVQPSQSRYSTTNYEKYIKDALPDNASFDIGTPQKYLLLLLFIWIERRRKWR